jgi:hypothetical protein
MGAHNVALPTHRYVWVDAESVLRDATEGAVHGLWFGIASHPGRAVTCHVLLDNGAIVHDLPWRHLAHRPDAPRVTTPDVVAWDAFGWDCEAVTFPVLTHLGVHVLDKQHHRTDITGLHEGWCVDWIKNGYSDEPEQVKLLHVIARDDGRFGLVPQDHLLIEDASFTTVGDGVPRIRRINSREFAE